MEWSGCPAVERVPGKVSGQWIVKGTRILADGVVENADAGYTAEELAPNLRGPSRSTRRVRYYPT
jgi:uncharacterized protein (DUF433 family)